MTTNIQIEGAIRCVVDAVKRDPINNAVLPAIGVGLFFAAWYYGILSQDTIEAIVCHDLC